MSKTFLLRLFLIALFLSSLTPAFVPNAQAQPTTYDIHLSIDPAVATTGETVVFSANVTQSTGDPINSGFVRFYVDEVPVGDVNTINSTSIFSTSSLTVGTHGIRATWYSEPTIPQTDDVASVQINEPAPVPADTPGEFYLFSPVVPSDTPGDGIVTIRRTGSLGAVTVNYATSDGSAVAGRDYTATSGVASFAAGQTDQTIRIPLLAAAANGSTLNVQLSNPTGGATLGNPSSLTVTIANSTPPPPSPYIALADAAYTQAAAYFAAGDQANGYLTYAYYEYYLYLLDPSANAADLSGYYQDLAYGYYISYTAAGDPAGALAWYNYYVSFI